MNGIVKRTDGEFEGDAWVEAIQVTPGMQEQGGERLRVGPLACCGKEAFTTPGRHPRECGEQGIIFYGCPLPHVQVDEHEVEPVEETRLERREVPVGVPA